MSDHDAATPRVDTRRSRLSAVWLVPLAALAVAGGVVWQSYQDRGPLITVRFPSASGIQAETTELRFLDLKAGMVEDITFADSFKAVDVHIRLDKKIADYVDADAVFWVVEPQVSARGITGLGTVLSGVYIEGSWDDVPGIRPDEFFALETPPLTKAGEKGTRIVLRARSGGQIAAGAPVLFNGIDVGRIGAPILSESGAIVTMDAFIAAPHDKRLSTNARFWDASGLSLDVGAGGVSVNVDSLAALIEGGITFGTPVAGGQAVSEGHIFEVFANEEDARDNAFAGDLGPRLAISALLDGNVSGLAPGTKIQFQGVTVGEVIDFSGVAQDGEAAQLRVDLELSIAELGLDPAAPEADLSGRIEDGLRLRLGTEGFLGQRLLLELVPMPDAPPASLLKDPQGRLLFPTSAAVKSDGASGFDSLIKRASALPIEELFATANAALSGVAGIVAAPEAQSLPQNADAFLTEARALVTADEIYNLLVDAEDTLAELREGRLVENFNRILASADGTLSTVSSAAGTLPGVTQRLNSAVGALEGVVKGYAPDSRFYGDLRETLREFTSAAESFRSLARTIERNPNSLITGR